MSEKERITQPSMGSNKLGKETEKRRGKGTTAGTGTQAKLAALSGDKQHKNKVKDDKSSVKKKDGNHFY